MDTPLLSLDDLKQRLGEPAPALLHALLEEREYLNDPNLLAGHLDSGRILTDASRIYSLAYEVWLKTTSAQRDALVGFSEELLAIAVDRALALRAETHPTEQRLPTMAAQKRAGRAQRDHLAAVLRSIAGQDSALSERISAATTTAFDLESIVRSINALVAIGRELVTHEGSGIAARVKLSRLEPAFLDRLEALEVELSGAAQQADARASASSQAEIKKLEAVNVYLLKLVVGAFEAAHEIDPSIVRLVPIATRRVLSRRRSAVPSSN